MFGREELECPGCKKMFRKKDMKTECCDAEYRRSKYFSQYSCIDCSTLTRDGETFKNRNFKSPSNAIEAIVEAWSSKSLNSEKLSSLYKERSVVSSTYNHASTAVGEAECNVLDAKDSIFFDEAIDGDDPAYQTAIAAKGRVDDAFSKAFHNNKRNKNEILMEIGRIERKIFCSICCELQPLRSPTAEDSGAFFCSVCDSQIESEYNSYQQTKIGGNKETTHFSTASTASSSKGEDPIKALKLRFAKGEITKEEFLEMKSMLE